MRREWNPFEQLESMFDYFPSSHMMRDGLVDSFPQQSIAVDVSEDENNMYVTADVPGVAKEDITLSVDGRVLTLHVDTTTESDSASDEEYLQRERRHTRFERRVRLPTVVDETEAEASYVNGVLSITLPKMSESDDSTTIEIE